MTDKHLNFILKIELDICTTKSQNELEDYIKSCISNGNNNTCNSITNNIKVLNVALCGEDCLNIED